MASPPASKRRRVEREARVDSDKEEEPKAEEEEDGDAGEISDGERTFEPGQSVLAYYVPENEWWPAVVSFRFQGRQHSLLMSGAGRGTSV